MKYILCIALVMLLYSISHADTYPKSSLCTVQPNKTVTCSCQCWPGWIYVLNSGKVGFVGPYTGMKLVTKGPFSNGYAATYKNTNPIMQNNVRIDIQCHD
jgi:hypothetical protein